MVNLLPLAEGETISTVLPLPEDEEEWKNLHVVFATAKGGVRRNSMDAFANVPTAGKFAMRFDEGDDDSLVGVALLSEDDDILLATRGGKAIRFAATDVREFQSRTSTGVRGMTLAKGDEVISLSILHRVGTSQEEREEYLRFAPWKGEREGACGLSSDRMAELSEREQFILTVTANGYGKRSSAYEYRRTNRGGQGIVNIDTSERNGHVVASFPDHGTQHPRHHPVQRRRERACRFGCPHRRGRGAGESGRRDGGRGDCRPRGRAERPGDARRRDRSRNAARQPGRGRRRRRAVRLEPDRGR
jgi:DNA gyrase subunit A